MTSILPQIETLESIPLLHQNYAGSLLKLIMDNLLQMDEVEIGTYGQGDDEGAVIAFDSNDSEDVRLELRYSHYQYFELVVSDDSEDINTSNFKYKITEESNLLEMIPETLREWMDEVCGEQEPKTYSVKKLKNIK